VHYDITVAGAEYGYIINALRHVGKQIGYFNPTLPVLLIADMAAEQFCIRLNKLVFGLTERARTLLAMQLVQKWLGIKRLDVTGPTCHKEKDYRFGFPLESRNLICSGSGGFSSRCLLKQTAQGQASHAATRFLEKIATGCAVQIVVQLGRLNPRIRMRLS
jgi:hypothetical protein